MWYRVFANRTQTLQLEGHSGMNWLASLLFVFLSLSVSCISMSDAQAQASEGQQDVSTETGAATDPHQGHDSGRWEGAPEGKAFSEFNHHFAGLCDMVLGLAE